MPSKKAAKTSSDSKAKPAAKKPAQPVKKVAKTSAKPAAKPAPKQSVKPAAKPKAGAAVKPWEHAKTGEGSGSDPLATRFVESLSYDRRLYRYDITGSIAHATMLAEVGLISPDEHKAIVIGLEEIGDEIEAAGADYGAAWPGWKVELEDVHMCIEAALIEKIGDAGRKLHTGRSRNDQVALDLALWVSDAALRVEGLCLDLCQAFLDLAKRDGHVVMPSYTHLQRAQPIVAAGELVAWIEAFARGRDRLASLANLNLTESPLGSGAIAGSSLPLDRDMTAEILGFEMASGSSIDATARRDVAVDFVYGLSMLSMTLSRWAEQWIIYCSTEFGFISLNPHHTTGSSMMPQKRNPDMLELIRGRCGNVYGNLFALLTILKGTPLAYNRDLQEDKRQLFMAYDIAVDCLEMAVRIVQGAKFNQERIEAGLERGFLDATSLAEYLVTKSVPFRTSHQVVGSLVRLCEAKGFHQLSQLAQGDFQSAVAACGSKVKVGPDVYEWLGAKNVVKQYKSYGNAGVSGTREQIAIWDKALASMDGQSTESQD
jgi:argininosuccinate lyase